MVVLHINAHNTALYYTTQPILRCVRCRDHFRCISDAGSSTQTVWLHENLVLLVTRRLIEEFLCRLRISGAKALKSTPTLSPSLVGFCATNIESYSLLTFALPCIPSSTSIYSHLCIFLPLTYYTGWRLYIYIHMLGRWRVLTASGLWFPATLRLRSCSADSWNGEHCKQKQGHDG